MTGTRRHAGYAVSLGIHLAIAAALLVVPFEMAVRHKSIVLDFSVVKGPGYGSKDDSQRYGLPKADSRNEAVKNRASSKALRAAEGTKQEKGEETRMTALVPDDRVADVKKGVVHADPQGQVAVAGEAAQGRQAVSTASEGAGPGAGRSGVKTLNYLGAGGADERNFSFIREKIMQSIIYPERARRMGWEGKVTLSFTVLENGSIDNVKIVNSSGFSILDESARDSVAKTNLKRKVPVRLVVLLPVEYRLK